MFIRKIKLNNYKIYKGEQSLEFEKDAAKNVYIVSGNNGYGKTSFLTSLVWCLYGKHMQEVDDTFKSNILNLGGYKKYLTTCLNQNASTHESQFSVEIFFSDIVIPGFTYNQISIKRAFDVSADNETLDILIDGQENELIHEVGKELFINDFILPKEIARFFFFDAEKNVSLAEMHSITDRRNLSQAYSEILGIKKYEELKSNLHDLRLRYRQSSAGDSDIQHLKVIEIEVTQLEKLKLQSEEKIKELIDEKNELKNKADRLQEKLIREGSTITIDELKDLQLRKINLSQEYEHLKQGFNEIIELAPFAIMGNYMAKLEKQIISETEFQNSNISQRILDKKISALKDNIKKIPPPDFTVDKKTKTYYEKSFVQLLETELRSSSTVNIGKVLHSLNKEELLHFSGIMENMRSSYRVRLSEISRNIKLNRFEFSKLNKQLTDAESKETDKLIQNYRNEKKLIEDRIYQLELSVLEQHKILGVQEHQYASKKRIFEEYANKVTLSEKYKEKDKLAARLIDDLDSFLIQIKNEKRTSLENRIYASLKELMHKQNFLTRVKVNISNEVIDILLFNSKGEILKENLSKGEQQLYVTALLKALVEESNIKFPVLIDSPMQKYDSMHASKVISEFYPSVSEQVILFPLLNKEMTEKEYSILFPFIKSAFIIENIEGIGSTFIPVIAKDLFKETKTKHPDAYQY